MHRRAFVVVLDACGAGELPDAADYGDAGTNTLGHVAEAAGGLDLPVLGALGLGSVLPLAGVPPAAEPVLHGRLHPLGPGKDTITGHWELMGVVTPSPLRTYPDGFPEEIVDALIDATGRGVLLNAPSNGIAAIDDYGEQQLADGPPDRLHLGGLGAPDRRARRRGAAGRALRGLRGRARDHARRAHRRARDRAAVPRRAGRLRRARRGAATWPSSRRPAPTSRSCATSGVPVHTVGKVKQVFADVGVDRGHPGATNEEAIASIDALIDGLDGGLVFANLVETDQVYGHRGDVPGFHEALRVIDAAVGGWLERLDPARDLLVITADHGCDPTTPGSDHTREHAPLLARFEGHGGRRHDGPLADVGASVLRWLSGRDASALPGEPFTP